MLATVFTFLIFPFMQTDTAATATRFEPKELPYAYDALAPQISEETLRYHHDKHYAGYVNKLNELTAGAPYAAQTLCELVRTADGAIYNNAAQAWNHEFYFEELSPEPQREPQGALLEAIDRSFGSFDRLKTQMSAAAAGLFGSGWVWLAAKPSGELVIVSEPNAGNPMRNGLVPLLAIDVWEHAYYIDYRNRRPDAVKAFWECVDWKTVGQRYDRR